MTINAGQTVSWDVVFGAVEYEAELLNAAAGAVLGTFVVTDNFIIAGELLAGQPHGNYNARVRARDAVGPGAWSGLLALEFVALPAPGNLRVL